MKRLEGKNILVTGGTSGIGYASALKLAENGANILISGRNEDRGNAVIKQISEMGMKAKFVRGDLTKKDDIDHLFSVVDSCFGRIDCAFNNAGIEGEVAYFAESTEENWDNVINTNLKSIWYCMKQEVSRMLESGGGGIVNMSSTSGLVGNGFGMTAYAASKYAIIGLTKSVALEYARQGIRVNALCPAFVETPMIDSLCERNPRLRRKFEGCQPLGRMAKPEEIAEAVLYLCSEESSFVTGSTFVIDGGLTI